MEMHFEGLPNKSKPAMKFLKADRWQCLDCGRTGPKHHIREHIEVHIEGLQYVCPGCETATKSRNTLRSHMVKNCNGTQKFKCRDHANGTKLSCPYVSSSKTSLDKHMATKHGIFSEELKQLLYSGEFE